MYAPPMPLEQPPMVDRPGVRALRGARPQMTPEMQRMRDWANSQRTATAANARNGDFILNPAGSGAAPAGVGIPTQMPTGEAPGKPSGWAAGLWADALASAQYERTATAANGPGGPSGLFGDWRSAAPGKPDYASGGGLNQNPGGTQQGGMQNPEGFTQQQNPWAPANWMNPGNRPQDSQSGGGWNPNGFNGFIGAGSNAPYNGPIGGGFSQNEMPPTVNPGQPMPPVKPGMLPNKPMEAPPPDKRGRLTGRRG